MCGDQDVPWCGATAHLLAVLDVESDAPQSQGTAREVAQADSLKAQVTWGQERAYYIGGTQFIGWFAQWLVTSTTSQLARQADRASQVTGVKAKGCVKGSMQARTSQQTVPSNPPARHSNLGEVPPTRSRPLRQGPLALGTPRPRPLHHDPQLIRRRRHGSSGGGCGSTCRR